jgi:hypothetical protein
MKSLYRSAAAAALSVGSLWAFSQGASAGTVAITAQVFTGNAPLAVGTSTPASESGNFIQSFTGSFDGGIDTKSPYINNIGAGPAGSAAAMNAPYSVLGDGAGSPIGSATYNVNSSSFIFLWGSPDTYNQVEFFSGPNGTGSSEGTFTGTNLACFASGTCDGTDFDLVTFTASGGDIGSVVFSNNTGAAFEFNIGPFAVATPLPSAIFLFGSLLGGVFWLGRRKHSLSRRKRSAVSSLGGT